jgi:hypothetical protein
MSIIRGDVTPATPHKPTRLIDQVLTNRDKAWDWKELSASLDITLEDVDNHPELPWNWGSKGLSKNQNMTIDFVLKHSNKKWDWDELALNPNMSPEDKDKHPELQWSWIDLTIHRCGSPWERQKRM